MYFWARSSVSSKASFKAVRPPPALMQRAYSDVVIRPSEPTSSLAFGKFHSPPLFQSNAQRQGILYRYLT